MAATSKSCPIRISAILKAALVLLHLEHDRPLPGGYAK
jgi:hypothetical protein